MDSNKTFHPDIETVEEFLQRFKLQNAEALDKAGNDSKKKAILLANCLPIAVVTDVQRRLKPKMLTDATFEEIEKHLTSSYGVKKSIIGAAVSFVNRKQRQQESIETYSKVINQMASECCYSDCCRDRMCRDVFISGLRSTRLISALITECEKQTFMECVTKAKTLEQVSQDVEDINPSARVNATFSGQNRNKSNQQSNRNSNNQSKDKKVPENYTCRRCSSKGKHFAEKCWAKNRKCEYCTKTGHIAKACYFAKRDSKNGDKNNVRIQKSNFVTANEDQDPTQYFTINSIVQQDQRNPEDNFTDVPTRNRYGPLQDSHNGERQIFSTSSEPKNSFLEQQQFQFLRNQ